MKQRYILHNNFSTDIDLYQKRLVRAVAERFGLRKTLDQNIAAHFTIKYWFEADEGELVQLERMLKEFSEHHISTPVTIGETNGFPPNVVFMDVHLSEEATMVFGALTKLLKLLEWMSWDRYDAPNLHYHSTIAEDCGEHYNEVLGFVGERHPKRLSASFDNITLTRQVAYLNGLPILKPYRVFNFSAA